MGLRGLSETGGEDKQQAAACWLFVSGSNSRCALCFCLLFLILLFDFASIFLPVSYVSLLIPDLYPPQTSLPGALRRTRLSGPPWVSKQARGRVRAPHRPRTPAVTHHSQEHRAERVYRARRGCQSRPGGGRGHSSALPEGRSKPPVGLGAQPARAVAKMRVRAVLAEHVGAVAFRHLGEIRASVLGGLCYFHVVVGAKNGRYRGGGSRGRDRFGCRIGKGQRGRGC
mmetsp:Transcript_2071/g.4457  ORF Transcript_2071/g.4457 Transcript_2071/m.4457 type:complete len:227 (-) Transcript_2071:771-1451(-)